MKVVLTGGQEIDLGTTEATPTIGIIDYSRRVTDDFGVTTVVPRGFARRLSVRMAVPFDDVDALQRRLADLRASSATWVADDRFAWLKSRGFYKDFSLDLAVPPVSYCTLTVEGLAETETVSDPGGDPAPDGASSTLQLLQPVLVTGNVLVSSSVPENDAPEWSPSASYAKGARVLRTATHRVYESLIGGNLGNDPSGGGIAWLLVGPSNRYAMFDQALGTATTAASSIAVTLGPGAANALALFDVVGATVRVQASGYDRTEAVTGGSLMFTGLPGSGQVMVTIAGSGQVAVGTLIVGRLTGLGITEASPTAGITDFSRKVVDDFGAVTVVQRAWAKRMTARALIRTDAIDLVANRIASVRALPSVWIGQSRMDSLTVYGFFKDFSIEVGESVSKLALTIEGLSKAAPSVSTEPPLVWRGPFSGSIAYEAGNLVQYGGSTWRYVGAVAEAGRVPPTLPVEANDWWQLFASGGEDGLNGKDGKDGKDGLNGNSGLPGQKGADGRTTFTHYAYANSPDGRADFSVNAPNGRAYEGSYTDFSEPDSLDPASYVWREYKGPPFGMDTRGGAVVAGNQVIKMSASAGWDADAFSTVGYRGGASVRFRGTGTQDVMAGLNNDPTTDTSYSSLDYAWNLQADGTAIIYESSALVQENGSAKIFVVGYGTGLFEVAYDGKVVRYLYNNVVHRTVDTARDRTFYFDSSLYSSGGRITDIDFKSLGSTGVSVEAYTLSSIGAVAAGYAPAGYINGLARAGGAGFDDSPTGSNGAPRSYTVCWRVRAPSDPAGEYWGARYFDIHGNGEIGYGPGDYPPNIAGMAQLLNAIPAGTPVTIHTNDEPSQNVLNPTLVAAMERCGGSVEFLRRIPYRGAYALIGVAGWEKGRGFEFVAGNGPNDPKAVIQANFIIVNNVPITSTSEEGNLVATLSNETWAIPTRGDGSYDVFPTDLSRGQMRVYFGGKDVTSLATFTIQNPFHLDGRVNADGSYYAVGLYNDSGYSYVIASYAGQAIAKTITATKSKSGALIQVSADKQSASFSKTGAYVSGDITITTSRQNAPDVPRFTIITADGTVHGYANLTAAEHASIFTDSFRTSGPDNLVITAAQVRNQLSGGYGNSFKVVATSGSLARDETTVARVNDGVDGAQGPQGPQGNAGGQGPAGANSVLLDSNVSSLTFAADYLGNLKSGQLAQTIVFTVTDGGVNVSNQVNWGSPEASGCRITMNSDGLVTFQGVSADGYVRVSPSYNGRSLGTKKVPIAVQRDAPPANSDQKASAYVGASSVAAGATSYPGSPMVTVVASIPSGTFNANYSFEYTAGGRGNATLAATLGFRRAGTADAWTFFPETVGSQARNAGSAQEPIFDVGGVSNAHASNVAAGRWEIGLFVRFYSGGVSGEITNGIIEGRNR